MYIARSQPAPVSRICIDWVRFFAVAEYPGSDTEISLGGKKISHLIKSPWTCVRSQYGQPISQKYQKDFYSLVQQPCRDDAGWGGTIQALMSFIMVRHLCQFCGSAGRSFSTVMGYLARLSYHCMVLPICDNIT